MKTYTDDVRVRYKTFCRAINKKQAVTTPENWMQALPAGTNGDTELFEKNSNINGFETFGQQIFLLLTS